MDLDALTLFHLAAEHGGLGRAARATGRSKTTLARRISDLELQLGARLFERGGSTFRLTEEGRDLLAATHEPLDELASAAQALRRVGTEPRGRLRVTVPLMFGERIMGAFVARFAERYPLVRLEIIAEDRNVDLVQEGFDIAVRARPNPGEDLVGRPILSDPLVVVAPPGWQRPVPLPDGRPSEVRAVVRAVGDEMRHWTIEVDGRTLLLAPNPLVRVSTLIVRDAVRAGAGAALFPWFFVRDDIAAGRLECWGTLAAEPLEFWALHASSRLTSRKVRAFIDMLDEYIRSI